MRVPAVGPSSPALLLSILVLSHPSTVLSAPAALSQNEPYLLQPQSPLPMLSDNTQRHHFQDDIITAVGRPTRYESTVLARRLLALSKTGVVSTVFPSLHDSSSLSSHPQASISDPNAIPSILSHLPIGQPEYISDCPTSASPLGGSPVLIALDVEITTQNARAGSNVSLSVSWWDEYTKLVGKENWAVADLPRVSVVGWLEELSAEDVEEAGVKECFLKAHHDAKLWLPGDKNAAHGGRWMRIVPEAVYWIGGFGNRHWIGWFDVEEWRGVKREEWEGVRLPGEKA